MSSPQKICLLGGSGFVGTELASQLTEQGSAIKVLSRDLRRLKELRVVPTVSIAQLDPYDHDQLAAAIDGQDVLINLVGILNESVGKGGTFEEAHAGLADSIVSAAQAAGVSRVIQIGALHANAEHGPSDYLKSKGKAAQRLLESNLDVTIVCPSVIFGAGDSFFNRFANLLRGLPIMPLACAGSRFAPVYVGDVAAAIIAAIDDPESIGKTINLCGPEVFTLREIVEYTAETLGIKRTIIDLPDGLARFQALMMEMVPGRPFSRDNFKSLQVDSVCEECDGVQPTPVSKIVPTYLGHMNRQSRLQQYRQMARRET